MPNEIVPPRLKAAVTRRAGGLCEYCRSRSSHSPGPFVADHIIPKVRGGETTLSNLALACSGCNGRKHAKVKAPDPLTGKSVRLFNPRRQRWSDHFAWSENDTLIIGLTATGRATVEALQVNRLELINLREAFRILKLHPPE
jgi:5-methylcytosine-specific restriction endonuclease McrA